MNMIDKPPIGGMGGSIQDWEWGKDPFHRDAFPTEFQQIVDYIGPRREGWLALDAWGNVVAFKLYEEDMGNVAY